MARLPANRKTSESTVKRTRRSTAEIVDRLIEAATLEFQEKGYTGATTAAIARRAEVTEALLFNHFGSKAKLFQDTIFKPLSKHFEAFQATHQVSAEDLAGRRIFGMEYIRELQAFVSDHSRMLLSLVYAQSYQSSDVDGLGEVKGLHDYFERSAELAAANLGKNPTVDPALMARISFVSIMACILFEDWVFPKGGATKADIRDAITHFVMDGLNANKPAR